MLPRIDRAILDKNPCTGLCPSISHEYVDFSQKIDGGQKRLFVLDGATKFRSIVKDRSSFIFRLSEFVTRLNIKTIELVDSFDCVFKNRSVLIKQIKNDRSKLLIIFIRLSTRIEGLMKMIKSLDQTFQKLIRTIVKDRGTW